MKKFVLLIVFTYFLCAKEEVVIGFTRSNVLDYTKMNDSIRYIQDWIKSFADKKNISAKMKFYYNDKKLIKDFKDNKLILIAPNTHALFLLKDNIDDIDIDNIWSMSFSNKDGIQYCLVKQKDIKENDFINKTVAIGNYPMAKYWFENMILKQYKQNVKSIVKEIKIHQKESTNILSTFFRKSDFTITTKNDWKTMINLNPAIKKKIILAQCSKIRFPLFLGVFKSNIKNKYKSIFISTILNIHKIKNFDILYNVINFNHFYKVTHKNLKEVEDFFIKYKELKYKYK